MFQYTTETIINSNKGKLASGKRFDVLDTEGKSIIDWSGANPALASGKSASDAFMLLIDGVNSFKVDSGSEACIQRVYRAAYRQASEATAVLDLSRVASADLPKADDIVRLTISIHEQGSVRSTIQNAYLHKNKPFHYEIAVKTATAAGIVADLAKLIKKDMAMTDFAYFKAVANGSQLELTADDCYIQFDDVKLEKVVEIEDVNTPLAAKLLGYKVVKAIDGISLTVTPGDEGQGTVARLVKNLRIPTGASINPFGADQGGKPVPGGRYDQFLIEYVTDRRHVSGTVVGSVGEKSLTSHVLFMHQDVAPAFATVLTLIGITPITAGKVAANPGVDTVDGKLALVSKKEMGSVE